MKIGVNWTAPDHLDLVKSLVREGKADFIEVLIDNFLSIPQKELSRTFDGIPVAFHIMNSQFLERAKDELEAIAKRIRDFSMALHPLYLSDHLGTFTFAGRRLPLMGEISYDQFDFHVEKISRWQELLGGKIHLENYPSVLPSGRGQKAYLERLLKKTGAGLLFDVSNAVVAELNAGVTGETWLSLASAATHFHIGGYSEETLGETIAIDSHDRGPSERSDSLLKKLVGCVPTAQETTLVVEWDFNRSPESWSIALDKVRNTDAA